MCFDDPALVERIKSALQALFEKQMWMNTLGITLSQASDPFAASTLFTSAFEFTWNIARSARNPHVVLVDPASMPVMAMKPFLLEGDRIFKELVAVLPDFLSERNGRALLPKPRWKELWASEPASIAAMEQQLVKLVEQALWAMGTDPACEVLESSAGAQGLDQSLVDSLSGDSVPFEAWMVSDTLVKAKTGDSKKKKRRKPRAPTSHALEPTAEEEGEEAAPEPIPEEEEDEGASHSAATEEPSPPLRPAAAASAWPGPGAPWRPGRPEDPASEDGEDLASEDGVGQGSSLHPAASEPSTAWGAEHSDDESVGMGTFHMAADESASASEFSRDPTATSTPVPERPGNGKGRRSAWRPAVTPPASPLAPHKAMHPTQLVCYIWNQTPQFESGLGSPRSAAGSMRSMSTTPLVAATPFARGQWTEPSQPGTPMAAPSPLISAVVRNTFVDIDDPSQRQPEAPRTSRSLSPSMGSRMDHWPDPWHL